WPTARPRPRSPGRSLPAPPRWRARARSTPERRLPPSGARPRWHPQSTPSGRAPPAFRARGDCQSLRGASPPGWRARRASRRGATPSGTAAAARRLLPAPAVLQALAKVPSLRQPGLKEVYHSRLRTQASRIELELELGVESVEFEFEFEFD